MQIVNHLLEYNKFKPKQSDRLSGTYPMPIYEYTCKDCGSDFELLIRGEEKAVCPGLRQAAHVTKSFSVPAAHSG